MRSLFFGGFIITCACTSLCINGKELIEAVRAKNYDLAKQLIEKGADVNEKEKGDWTALHEAARLGNPDMVKLLLDAGADVKAKTGLGDTPLHESANANVAKLLIEKGAIIDERNKNKGTALWIAAENGRADVVKLLLQKGADPEAKGSLGQTPLHIACRRDEYDKRVRLDIVKLLCEKKVKINAQDDSGNTPLHNAAGQGNELVVKFLLGKGANPVLKANDGSIPLHKAAASGRLAAVEPLLDMTAYPESVIEDPINSVDKNGNTPLHYAVLGLDIPVVNYLLEQGAIFDQSNKAGQRPELLIPMREERDPTKEAEMKKVFEDYKKVVGDLLKVHADDRDVAKIIERIEQHKKKPEPKASRRWQKWLKRKKK